MFQFNALIYVPHIRLYDFFIRTITYGGVTFPPALFTVDKTSSVDVVLTLFSYTINILIKVRIPFCLLLLSLKSHLLY